MDAAVGEATIKGYFENCSAYWDGGAIVVTSVKCDGVPKVKGDKTVYMTTRTNHLNLDGARFYNCTSTITGSEYYGNGGAVHVSAQTHTFDVTNCWFEGCSSANTITNASGGGLTIGYYNLVDNFKDTDEGGDSYWTAGMINQDMDGDGDQDNDDEWGGGRRSDFYTWIVESDGTTKSTNRTTLGTVNISGTTFKDCSSGFQGGGFMVRTGSCITDLNVTNVTIDNCSTQDRGSAVFFNNCIVATADFEDCIIQNCKITNPESLFGGTLTTIGTTTMVLTVKNCQFLNNISYDSGGGLYWNSGNPRPKPEDKDTATLVQPKATVTGCTFQGNEATTRYGGGIFTECEMTITNCTFDGNRAGTGGGICMGVYNNSYRMMRYDEKAELALDAKTSFYNNTATYGGAIAIRANATESLVNYPQYPYYDGDGNLVAPEIVHRVSFKLGGAQIYNNTATRHGGGIYYKAESGYADPLDDLEVAHYEKSIVIDDGTIYGNVAQLHGGGIYMSSSENTYITVTDGVIYDNEAGVQYSEGTDEEGNPITVQTITGGNGGAIYLTGNNALVTITGGAIGAIPPETEGGTVTAAPNTAYEAWETWIDAETGEEKSGWVRGRGGGISVCDGARIQMSGGQISYNKGYNGGGIAIYKNDDVVSTVSSGMEYTGGIISYNEAEHRGGGVFVHSGGYMTLKGGLLTENYAKSTGGGLGALGGATVLITKQVVDGKEITPVISKNSARYGGGISAVMEGTSVTVEYGTIIENKAINTMAEGAVALGGAIYVANKSTMTITGGTIQDNTSDTHGGAIAANSYADVLINGGVISGNSVNNDGGAIFATAAAKLTIRNGEISSNTAGNYGGGIAAFGAVAYGGADLELSGGKIINNYASLNGGGFYLAGSDSDAALPDTGWDDLDGITGSNNDATEGTTEATEETTEATEGDGTEGGADDSETEEEEKHASVKAVITGGEISGNSCAQNGAGLCVNRSSNLTIEYAVVKNNTALREFGNGGYGGGMFTGDNCVVTINGGEFTNNTAYCGAGVYGAGYSTVYFDGGIISYNNASDVGGGLVATQSAHLYIRGTTISYNTAQSHGGGIYAATGDGYHPKIWIERHAEQGTVGVITHNTAYGNGGGVFVGVGGMLYVSEGHITYNKAVGMDPNYQTGHNQYAMLGAGGGICVSTYDIYQKDENGDNLTDENGKLVLDESLSLTATFELVGGVGKDLAIYGNLADFAGDDVFSNGRRTTLTIPDVQDMNLSGYDFKPEGWFEDYAYHDTSYTSGLNLGVDQGIDNSNVTRYRGSSVSYRVHISPENLATKVSQPDAYVAMTLGIPGAVDDTVVVDHDLPVKINLMDNDLMITEQEFADSANLGLIWPELSEKDGIYYGEGKDPAFSYTQFTREAGQLSFGTAKLEGHEVTFTLTDKQMTAEDSFYYVVGHDSPDADTEYDYYHYAKVTVIPATSIYYEDNSGFVTYSDNWIPADWLNSTNPDQSTDLSGKYQDQDRPGAAEIPSIDADNIYGNDSNYQSAYHYSMDSAMKVRVSEGIDATATFTFTGTGFDVIGLSSNNTGMVMADLYKGSGDSAEYMDTVMVDTYYGSVTQCYRVNHVWLDGKWYVSYEEKIDPSEMLEDEAVPTDPVQGTRYWTYETKIIPQSCTGYQTNFYKLTHTYTNWKWVTTEERIDPADFGTDEAKPSSPKEGAVYHTYEVRLEVDPDFTAEPEYWCMTYTYQNGAYVLTSEEQLSGETAMGISGKPSAAPTEGHSYSIQQARTAVGYFKLTHTWQDGAWITTEEQVLDYQVQVDEICPSNPSSGDSYVTYTQRMVYSPNDTIYQVPVIKRSGLEYGTYTVEIYVAYSSWFEEDRPGYDWCDFYLDAIRIYDPANNGVINGETNQVIQDAYLADKEAWPTYHEIRNLLIEADKTNIYNTNVFNGAIFIDGNAALDPSGGLGDAAADSPVANKKPQIVDYANFGPNNEVYLAPGQGISFRMNLAAADLPEGVEIASVQIGLRATNLDGRSSLRFKVYENGKYYFSTAPVMTLSTCAETYYDITFANDQAVVIWADSSNPCPLAITNMKITYTGNPYQTASGSVEGDSGSTMSIARQIMTMDYTTAQQVLASLTEQETEQVVPTLTAKYPSLSFEEEIRYNVYFDVENLGDLTSADLGLVTFTTENRDGTVDTAADVIYGAAMENDLYVVSTNGIAAKNMGDTLYFKVFAKLSDGSYVYSNLYHYSALSYAKNTLAKSTDQAQKALVVAMLNYGAQAQSFFDHNADSLMNADLTQEQQALVSVFSTDDLKVPVAADASKSGNFPDNDGFSGQYPTVSFEGAFGINYHFIPRYVPEGDITFCYWNEDTYNAVQELTVDNADGKTTMVGTDGVYSGSSGQIVAKNLDQTVYAAAFYEYEGVRYCSGVLTYSIASYCRHHAADAESNMNAFANAAAIYACAAKAYFES